MDYMNEKAILAAQIPLPNDRCPVKNCPYYSSSITETCSRHYGYNAYVLYNILPKDIIKNIIEFIQHPKKNERVMTDGEIIQKLEYNYEELIYDDQIINERIFWFQNNENLHLHCEQIKAATHYLQLNENKKLSKIQAENLLNIISMKYDNYTSIAFQKAIFLKTLAPMNLDRNIFSVAYCYLGNYKSPITAGMTKQKIKHLIYG
jgi:hypothetical protein